MSSNGTQGQFRTPSTFVIAMAVFFLRWMVPFAWAIFSHGALLAIFRHRGDGLRLNSIVALLPYATAMLLVAFIAGNIVNGAGWARARKA